jgi:hypothetical protein
MMVMFVMVPRWIICTMTRQCRCGDQHNRNQASHQKDQYSASQVGVVTGTPLLYQVEKRRGSQERSPSSQFRYLTNNCHQS